MLKICILHNLRQRLQQIENNVVFKDMITIRRATADDWTTVRKVAEMAFPATYSDILSERQIDYMMEWMYSAESLVRQMEEGHVFYIAYDGDGVPVGYVSIQPGGKMSIICRNFMCCPNGRVRESDGCCFPRQWQR